MRDIFVILIVALTTTLAAKAMQPGMTGRNWSLRQWTLEFLAFWFFVVALFGGCWIIAIAAGGHQ